MCIVFLSYMYMYMYMCMQSLTLLTTTVCVCVCVCVSDGDAVNSERQVLSLAPWNKHVLGIRSLADRSNNHTHYSYEVSTITTNSTSYFNPLDSMT